MYLAELRGKLSTKTEGMEDILTSNVFSFFKYANRGIFLRGYLKELGFDITEEEVLTATFDFWPRYEDFTEPDLVILAGSYYFLIEAKYFSDFGEETEKTKAQLVREVNNGIRDAKRQRRIFKLIAVTADSYQKSERLNTLPKQLIPYCKWTNWQHVAKFIKQVFEKQNTIPSGDRIFASDLYALLDKKNLRSFIGLGEILSVMKALKACGRVYFDAKTAKFRGDFIGFEESLLISKPLLSLPNYIFLDQSKQLFQNINYPITNNINNSEIFFRRL